MFLCSVYDFGRTMNSGSVLLLFAIALGVNIRLAHGACPDGYCRHSGGCYLIVSLRVSWIDARSYCTVFGGTLLTISSSTMQSATEGALRKTKGIVLPGKFWLDVTDLLNPKDWKRMSDKANLQFSNWQMVNATEGGNCVAMVENQNYQWSAFSCDEKHNFICYTSGEPERVYNRYSYKYEYEDVSADPQC